MNMTKERIKSYALDHGDMILTVGGCIGTLAAVGLTWWQTRKAYRQVEEAPKEEFKRTWHYYISPLCTTLMAIGMVIGSNKLSADKNAALMASYISVCTALQEYREKTAEILGAEEEEKLYQEVMTDIYADPDPAEPEVLFIDDLTGAQFYKTLSHMKDVRYEFNKAWAESWGYASFQALYDMYGVEVPLAFLETRDICAEHFGWDASDAYEYGYFWINIDYQPDILESGETCYHIVYKDEPKEGI